MSDRFQYRTPGTSLWWSSLDGWIIAAHRLKVRPLSPQRDKALKAHGCFLPRDVIDAAADVTQIDYALHLLKHGPPPLCRPLRGERAEAGQTQVIVDLMNRRRALERAAGLQASGHNAARALQSTPPHGTTIERTSEGKTP